MRRFTIVLLASLALLPAAPAAAGVRIAWPSDTTVAPGDTVAVGVRSDKTVRVALLRMTGDRPTAVVAARRMRRGRFATVVPAAGTFLLAVDRGPRRFSRVIEAVAPAPPQPACAPRGSSVATTIDRRSAARGEVVTMTIRNTGATCLTYGAEFLFERWTGEGWEPAGTEMRAWPAWAAGLDPGQTHTVTTEVWRDIGTGRHRLAKYFWGPDGTVVAAEEIDVTG